MELKGWSSVGAKSSFEGNELVKQIVGGVKGGEQRKGQERRITITGEGRKEEEKERVKGGKTPSSDY